MAELFEGYRRELAGVLDGLPLETLGLVLDRLTEARCEGSQVFIIGNGGSATTASHMACDFSKSTIRDDLPRMRVVPITDSLCLITAWANDTEYGNVFAEQLKNLARRGDVLIALSGSGSSENVLRAVRHARELGLTTIGFTGLDGVRLRDLADLCVVVSSRDMGKIEDMHVVMCHMLTEALAHQEVS